MNHSATTKLVIGWALGVMFIVACGAAVSTKSTSNSSSAVAVVYDADGEKIGYPIGIDFILLLNGYIAQRAGNEWSLNAIYYTQDSCAGTPYVPSSQALYQKQLFLTASHGSWVIKTNSAVTPVTAESRRITSGACSDINDSMDVVEIETFSGTVPDLGTIPPEIRIEE